MADSRASIVADAPLAVYHRARRPRRHNCQPRMLATCADCGTEYVLCRATKRAVGQMIDRVWTDAECGGRGW